MTLLATNFSSNTLSGTVTVYGGAANINLGTITPSYLTGQKSFVVKLRKNSVDGAVVGTSTSITIPDRSSIVSVTANVASISEGDLIQYTITTSNVAQDTLLYYDTASMVGNVDASDFNGGNTGTVLIHNNTGTFTIRPSADLSLLDETGESYKINLRSNSSSGNIVYRSNTIGINDTSKTITVLSVVANATIAYDTDIVTFTINTRNANGTTLYYTTLGSMTSAEIVGGGTGTFVPTSNDDTKVLTLKGNGIIATPRNIKLEIRETSIAGNVRYTAANVFFISPPPVITGGSIDTSSGYTTHVFTSPGTLSVTSVSPIRANVEYYIIGGGGGGGAIADGYGLTAGGGAGGVNRGNLTVTAGTSYTATIGGGGAGGVHLGAYSDTAGTRGTNTTFTSPGFPGPIVGLFGGTWSTDGPGGSGGGGNPGTAAGGAVGYPGPTAQGYPGGIGSPAGYGGGGGGAGGSGNSANGQGGIGISIAVPALYGTAGPGPGQWFGGGGGCRTNKYPNPAIGQASWGLEVAGGAGGGGPSGFNYTVPTGSPLMTGNAGYQNTGGGGGAAFVNQSPNTAGDGAPGGQGGSGIVIIRYNSSAGDFTYTP
jgi:hypothetical protein